MNKKKVAIAYDVDYTLMRGFHPDLLLASKGIEPKKFWEKVDAIEARIRKGGQISNSEITYMSLLQNEINKGRLRGLTIKEVTEIGKGIEKMLYPGLPEFFSRIREENPDAKISHNLVSSGIAQILEGSVLRNYADKIFGHVFYDGYTPGNEIDIVTGSTSSVEKIDAVVQISRGKFSEKNRYEFPFKNMIYIGDGQTDVPAFRFLKRYGGKRVCVYDEKNPESRKKAEKLRDEVDIIVPADYREGSRLWNFVNKAIRESC